MAGEYNLADLLKEEKARRDMGTSKLPPKDSPELQQAIEDYRAGRVYEVARRFGYKRLDNIHRAMRSIGIEPSKAGFETPDRLSEIEQQVLDIVKSGAVSVGEVSRQIDRSRETVIKTIDSLREKSYEVHLDESSKQVSIPEEPAREFKSTEFKYFRKYYRMGLVSDTQIGSKYQQMTLLYDAYAEFKKQKVDFALHAGDFFEGVGVFSGQDVEIFMHDPFGDEQIEYADKNYPHADFKTYIIGGQHDRIFWKRHGRNIIEALCKKRKDLVNRGFYKAEFSIKGLKVGLMHPGGGVAYARSYKMQKIIENMVGFIASIPKANAPILEVMGHWHIPCHLPSYMGIDAVSLPCFQSQTPYLEQKGLMPVVGYAIAELWLDRDKNESKVTINFYNQNAQIRENDYR